jgi:co-chaperonin GroES (HSP10)
MPEALVDLRCDIRATKETDLFEKEVNRRSSLKYITDEWHNIPTSAVVRLNEVPDRASGVTISGYTEVPHLPTVSGQFYVDYVLGYVTFHTSDANKPVNPIYFGKGSAVDAEDINKVYELLTQLNSTGNALRAYAQSTPNTSISIKKGNFYMGPRLVKFLGNDVVRMGTGGEYVVSAMNTNYYNKILFAIDTTRRLNKYEGTPAGDKASVVEPAIPREEMPVCLVTVQDDGSAQAGSILPINEGDIEDRRLFLSRPLAKKYFSVPIFGTVITGTVFDGFVWDEDVVITRVSMHAMSAPSGGIVSIDLLKNGQAQGRVVSLASGTMYNTADIQYLDYATGDMLGIGVTEVDPQEACEGLRVILHYLSY